jgi:hypothetical protein
MATISGRLGQLVHDTADGLLKNNVPQKLAETTNTLVTSGFDIVADVLEIVRDVTKPDPAAPPGP